MENLHGRLASYIDEIHKLKEQHRTDIEKMITRTQEEKTSIKNAMRHIQQEKIHYKETITQ